MATSGRLRARRVASVALRRYLDPREWAQTAASSVDAASAWANVEKNLHRAGFDRPMLLHDLRLDGMNRYPVPSERLGTMLSSKWEAFCASNSHLVNDDPVRNRVGAQAQFGFCTDAAEALGCTAAEARVLGIYRDFGMLAAVHHCVTNPKEQTTSALCIAETRDAPAFLRLHDELTSVLDTAFVHFLEGLHIQELARSGLPRSLSRREADCLSWVQLGWSTRQIARRLSLSEWTVDEYIASAQRKLGASNRAQACARAMLLAIIAP